MYIEHEQRGLEARRDQQVLEVLVAAVVEKLVDDLLRVETKREAFRSSAIEPIVEFSQVEGRSWSEDTVRASDYIVADSAFLMRELSPANAGITRSFFYYFCFVFGERPVLFGREPNPVIRSWDKRGHVQTATRAQWVGAIDAAQYWR